MRRMDLAVLFGAVAVAVAVSGKAHGILIQFTARDNALLYSPAGGQNGEAYLDFLPYFSVGNPTLNLPASRGQQADSNDVAVIVQNLPPYVQPAPTHQVVEIGVDPIVVVADLSDSDRDMLSYVWVKDGKLLGFGVVRANPCAQPAATYQAFATGADAIIIVSDLSDYDDDMLSRGELSGGEVLGSDAGEMNKTPDLVALPELSISAGDRRFPVGQHVIQLWVSDGVNHPIRASVSVEVIDTTAPSLSPVPSVTILWPPSHELQPVTIQANASDNGGGATDLAVTVCSSEPPETDGNGKIIPDYYVASIDNETGIIELLLRAESSGEGNGRTYTVTIRATDESQNQSEAVLRILAPDNADK